ncbi:MAG: replication-relaxation family protein [Fimbriimonadaceae bacterium]|nr:replication-relaxation family protein [Fimbriimonadaceae bacterium]QOJ10791.1 MAG: replication-relaxation family protein [Chthonomonadaceae bacterium]
MTRITRRDVSVLRDLALSHVLSRDQLMQLGYFGSITRANTRTRELVRLGFARRLESPFFSQSLFMVTKQASDVVGERISGLIENRAASPRFVQHAMSVTNVRIALSSKSNGTWRFEQQLWRTLKGSTRIEVRPDGLYQASQPIFIEVDMGHASATRFKEKLTAYEALARSGQCQALYGFNQFRVLTVTTGSLRSRHLVRLQPPNAGFEFLVRTFEEVGATPISPWS